MGLLEVFLGVFAGDLAGLFARFLALVAAFLVGDLALEGDLLFAFAGVLRCQQPKKKNTFVSF